MSIGCSEIPVSSRGSGSGIEWWLGPGKRTSDKCRNDADGSPQPSGGISTDANNFRLDNWLNEFYVSSRRARLRCGESAR